MASQLRPFMTRTCNPCYQKMCSKAVWTCPRCKRNDAHGRAKRSKNCIPCGLEIDLLNTVYWNHPNKSDPEVVKKYIKDVHGQTT